MIFFKPGQTPRQPGAPDGKLGELLKTAHETSCYAINQEAVQCLEKYSGHPIVAALYGYLQGHAALKADVIASLEVFHLLSFIPPRERLLVTRAVETAAVSLGDGEIKTAAHESNMRVWNKDIPVEK